MKKKRRILFWTAACVLLIAAAAFTGVSYEIGKQVVEGSTQLVTNEETAGAGDSFWKKYGMDYDRFCAEYEIERVEITSSFDGHTIPADYILAEGSGRDNKTAVLVHGLGGNRLKNYPAAEIFLGRGYNVLTYDQRSSNENTAPRTTFGYWEKYDLIDCIHYVREYAPEQKLGIWGTSFGGATACLALGFGDTEELVDFLILDCPVSSMEWMIQEELRKMDTGIPAGYMTFCGNIVNKMELGFFYQDADAADSLKEVDIPILIINSRADEVTPYFMGRDIYDAVQGENKHIWTVADSRHADVFFDYREEYIERAAEVLGE